MLSHVALLITIAQGRADMQREATKIAREMVIFVMKRMTKNAIFDFAHTNFFLLIR